MRAAGVTGFASLGAGCAGSASVSVSGAVTIGAGEGASGCAAAGLEANSASKMRRTRLTGGRMPSTVTGHRARFTFLMSPSLGANRVVQPELQHAVDRLCFGHAQLGARPDLFQPPTERQVVTQPDVALRGPPAVAVETLQVIGLQVQTAADPLANAALKSVRADGEAQVQPGQPIEGVVDVGLHQVVDRVARDLPADVAHRRRVGADGDRKSA